MDAWMNKGPSNLRLSEKESPKANRLSRDMCESVIGYLLLQGYLKEDFHFTPYSTISYLVLGTFTHLYFSHISFHTFHFTIHTYVHQFLI